jgi:hypothetical protein
MPCPASTSHDQRTGAVAFHRDAWLGGDGGEDALEDAVTLRVVLAAESDEWFGSYLFQGDGFEPSEMPPRWFVRVCSPVSLNDHFIVRKQHEEPGETAEQQYQKGIK